MAAAAAAEIENEIGGQQQQEEEEEEEEEKEMKSMFKTYQELQLMEFKDKFVFIPNFSSSSHSESPSPRQHQQQGFSISRHDGNIQPLSDDTKFGSPSPNTCTIYGVAGTIRLLAGNYVFVITSRKKVGMFLGSPVFKVMSMRLLCCNEDLRNSSSSVKKDEAYFINLLKVIESTPGLYYSYETDLTLNLQRRCKLAEGWRSKPLWKQNRGGEKGRRWWKDYYADPRFVWNRILLEELIENKLDEFIIPVVQGSFQTAELVVKGIQVTVTLMSRRCTRRLGTRMWRRGANLEGDAANFIETEQLVELEGFSSSLLQVRGSIPLLWEQVVDLSYRPQLKIINHPEQSKVVERHFYDLQQRYGETIAVDLTNKHGDEGQLSMAYAAEVGKLPHVRYVSFDFHHHCGSSNFDNLQLLYDQLSEDIQKQGYFQIDAEGKILAEQKGICRVNCIDCLDRTNVTESYFAQKSLDMQLQKIGVFTSSDFITMFEEEYRKFRIAWAEQGDEISLEYAGTYALKGDMVRYGRSTLTGSLKDGVSCLSRYYLNNFHDGHRQDAMDLISGRYTVNRSNPSPFQLNGFESLSYLPVASALLIGGLTATTFTLKQAGQNAQQFLSSVLWAGVTAGVMALVKTNGRQFCSRPRLCGDL